MDECTRDLMDEYIRNLRKVLEAIDNDMFHIRTILYSNIPTGDGRKELERALEVLELMEKMLKRFIEEEKNSI